MKRVLITGASGRIGTLLREQLNDGYDIVGLVRRPADFPHVEGDITSLDDMLRATQGIDAIVHMAGDPDPGAEWDSVLQNNIVGTYNIYEAAARNGVQQVIFASTNHTVSMWEVEAGAEIYEPGDGVKITPEATFRPDSYYGVSKAAGEVLGRYYSDFRDLRVICLRIGWVLADDVIHPVDLEGEAVPPVAPGAMLARGKAIYLSQRDCAELVRCSLEADDVQYGVYYGVSDNPHTFYLMENATRELGYRPQDAARTE